MGDGDGATALCRVRRRAHLRGGLDAGRIGVAPTACGVRWAAPWGRSGVVPAGRRPGGAAAREGGRGPVLARRSRYDHRQNWWRLSEPTFLRGPPCSKLGGGRPGAAAGGRRGARPLSGSCQKVGFTSKSQRKRLQTGRGRSHLDTQTGSKLNGFRALFSKGLIAIPCGRRRCGCWARRCC